MDKRGQLQSIAIVLLVLCLLFVIGVLIYLNVPLSGKVIYNNGNQNSNSYNSQTQQKTCTIVSIPYTTTEEYTEKVPYYTYDDYYDNRYYTSYDGYYYGDRNRRSYSDSGNYEYIDTTFNNLALKGKVKIYNKDDRSRFFTVRMYYTPRGGDTMVKEDYGYIRGEDSRTFTTYYYDNEYNHDANIAFDYTIIPEDQYSSGRGLLRYQNVVKTKTVTKYRTEQICN